MEIPPFVLEFLQEHNSLTLATASLSAVPWAATMVYVNDSLTLYCGTRPDSVTARHIEQNQAVSFAIEDYNPDWSQTRAIQGDGEAAPLTEPPEIERIVRLFQEKYSLVSAVQTNNLLFIRITPTSIRFIASEQAEAERVRATLGAEANQSVVYNVFRDLPQQTLDALAEQFETLHVEPGEVIVRQGTQADRFFIIADGEVEVIRVDDLQAHTVARLQRGQFFGEMAILRDITRTATVKAVLPTTLLALGRNAFQSLVAQSMATTEDFDQVIQERLNHLIRVRLERLPADI